MELGIQKYVMVSSFVPEVVSEMAKCLKQGREFMLNRLCNRGNKPETDYTPSEGTDGINISATYLTAEIVQQTHRIGKTVGVWLARSASVEDKAMYELCFGLKVDFVYFDVPIPAMGHRDQSYK